MVYPRVNGDAHGTNINTYYYYHTSQYYPKKYYHNLRYVDPVLYDVLCNLIMQGYVLTVDSEYHDRTKRRS